MYEDEILGSSDSIERPLQNLKLEKDFNRLDDFWAEVTSGVNSELTTFSKSDYAPFKNAQLFKGLGIDDSLGFEDYKKASSPASVSPITFEYVAALQKAQKSQINLDKVEEIEDPKLKLMGRLMKAERVRLERIGKSVGGVSEEMQNFYERYKHLFHESVQKAILGAIRALDFPLFSRLMSEGLASTAGV
jgi:hypothetical protein